MDQLNPLVEVEHLHSLAMVKAEEAFLLHAQKQFGSALPFFDEAYQLESQAALLLSNNLELEPTRSVLLRSAASLALKCNYYRDSERLVSIALSGNPPEDVADELRNIFEESGFHRHLDLRGKTLKPQEIQLTMWGGEDVGYGKAKSSVFIKKLSFFENLIFRTIERVREIPFREQSTVPKAISDRYEVFVQAPAAGSFSVTFVIGSDQLKLPGLDDASHIVEEVVDTLNAVAEDNEEALKERIPDPLYYNNFISLASKIRPDGESVGHVGVLGASGGELKKVHFRPAVRHQNRPSATGKKVKVNLTLSGTLEFADSREKKSEKKQGRTARWGRVTLTDAEGQEHPIKVAKEKMNDIVRPYFGYDVNVEVEKVGQSLVLVDIDEKK